MLWSLFADSATSVVRQSSHEVSQDVRHTFRLWAARPWHAGFAIAALAIGIGANTGVFSVVNALLLRSLPFHEPDRLAALSHAEFIPPHGSAKQFHDWRQQSTYFADVALTEETDVNLGGVRDPGRAHVAQTSWNFFSTLGTQPALGRGFMPEEDTPGHNAIAVVGYGLWQQLFAGDRRVLGTTIRINGDSLTIVGVAPPGFDYPGGAVLWKPAKFDGEGNNGWDTVARLKPGISWPQAREAFYAEVDRLYPNRYTKRPRMTPLRDALAGPAKSGSLVLMASVLLVLLIACTNVANLLMARTADRAPELSIRSALGASRARLARQLLTECLRLSLVAAMAGLGLAFWTTSIAVKVQPPALAAQSYSILDGRVLGFAALASVLSSLLFGVLPSLYAGRIHTFGSRDSGQTRGSRLVRETLVAAQVMLTIILFTASVSVGRAFVHLMRTDRGFNVQGLVTVSVSLGGTTQQVNQRELPYFEEVLARVRRLPGVRSASATEFLPLYATGFLGGPVGLDGHPAKRGAMVVPVLSDYLQTMGGRILSGRDLTDAEVHSGAKVAVINEHFAREFGGPAEVLGRQITQGNRPLYKIIGVAQGMDYETDPSATAGRNQIFFPSHSPGGFFSTFVVRVNGRAEDRLAMVRDSIRSVDPQVPVFGVKTMAQRLDDTFARPRFYSTAVLLFAVFALLLAVIGIYGIVSYAVTQRTREMGVRMALGTTPIRLRAVLLRQGLLTVAARAIPGVAGAMLSGRLLERLIEGAKSFDPAMSALVVLLIALIASTSIWAATRRIAGLDIMTILRSE
jgi:predicted permease